jgi:Ca2+-binding RTX toxin-like protein
VNIYGSNYRDRLNGTSASDMLVGLGGADVIYGQGGEDLLIGGRGADYLYGGSIFLGALPEFDMAAYWDSWEGVYVDLATGLGYGGTAEGDHLFDIEGLWGSHFADQLAGTDGDNVFEGLGGDDWLVGHGGRDELFGGDGHDMLEGGSGGDVLNGGDGTDTAVYAWSSEGVSVNLWVGFGGYGDAGGDAYVSIENVIGSRHRDIIDGNWADNWLVGNDGDDYLDGHDGADTLEGGMGQDFMYGRDGADTFVWTSTRETDARRSAADIVGDFDSKADRIDLRLIDADETTAGDQAFAFIGSGEFTAPGQIRVVVRAGGPEVLMNTDADVEVEAAIYFTPYYAGPGDVRTPILDAECFLL